MLNFNIYNSKEEAVAAKAALTGKYDMVFLEHKPEEKIFGRVLPEHWIVEFGNR